MLGHEGADIFRALLLSKLVCLVAGRSPKYQKTGTCMTEITRVPLQPIAKGSLTKLWLGVLLVALLSAGLAWISLPKGVALTTVKAGSGPKATLADVVIIKYTGKLTNGKVFDSGDQVPLPVEGMIPGFTEGLQKMQKGGSYKLSIPAAKAYGPEEKSNPQTGEVVIPANSDLTFEIDIQDIVPRDKFEAMMQMQQMQAQGAAGAGGAPGGAPGAEAPPEAAPKKK